MWPPTPCPRMCWGMSSSELTWRQTGGAAAARALAAWQVQARSSLEQYTGRRTRSCGGQACSLLCGCGRLPGSASIDYCKLKTCILFTVQAGAMGCEHAGSWIYQLPAGSTPNGASTHRMY
jgi:hypothetical protein